MDYEYVYILTNDCMPEWIKVGKTKNIKKRLSDLYNTSVPLPFECFAYLSVPTEYIFQVEHGLHDLLGRSYSKEKEFFRTTATNVLDFFKNVSGYNKDFVLVEHPESEEEEKKKSKKTTFKLLSIPVGSELVYTSDSSIVVKTYDLDNKIIYNNEILSISAFVSNLKGYNVNGYKYFTYKDEVLFHRKKHLRTQ